MCVFVYLDIAEISVNLVSCFWLRICYVYIVLVVIMEEKKCILEFVSNFREFYAIMKCIVIGLIKYDFDRFCSYNLRLLRFYKFVFVVL